MGGLHFGSFRLTDYLREWRLLEDLKRRIEKEKGSCGGGTKKVTVLDKLILGHQGKII